MDATAVTAPAKSVTVRTNRFLPYWAVFQADVKQTLTSWLYRLWVLVTVGAAAGYMLYRYGAKQVAGMVAPVPEMMSDLLQWIVHGSVMLIIVLTAGTICGERGTMADSVLSRGISRVQYFLGKWHARLAVILTTYFALGLTALIAAFVLLHGENLTLLGSLLALVTVAAMLVPVITCGVTVSATVGSTLISIAVVWMILYGSGFMLSLLPTTFPTPDRLLVNLPNILRGFYDAQLIGRLILWSLGVSVVIAIFGMISFSRRDV